VTRIEFAVVFLHALAISSPSLIGVTIMATSFASVSLTPSLKSASWCFLTLEHLDGFAKLAWYLVADGKLVEDTFARTIAKLDMTAKIAKEKLIPTTTSQSTPTTY
jgi:hypothetical protein